MNRPLDYFAYHKKIDITYLGQMLQMKWECFLDIFLSQVHNHSTVIVLLRQKKWPKSSLTSSAASDILTWPAEQVQ